MLFVNNRLFPLFYRRRLSDNGLFLHGLFFRRSLYYRRLGSLALGLLRLLLLRRLGFCRGLFDGLGLLRLLRHFSGTR